METPRPSGQLDSIRGLSGSVLFLNPSLLNSGKLSDFANQRKLQFATDEVVVSFSESRIHAVPPPGWKCLHSKASYQG